MSSELVLTETDSLVWVRITAFLSARSLETQRTYAGIIREWCEFLGSTPGTPQSAIKLLAATDLEASAYRVWLEKRPGQRAPGMRGRPSVERTVSTERLKPRKKDGLDDTLTYATIAKKFAALRRMYRMLVASDIGISINPFDPDRVASPPRSAGQKRPTQMIDSEFVRRMLELPDLATPRGIRDAALMALLFGAGLRRGELVNLRIGDVRRSRSGTTFLHLRHTKARKDADQSLPEWAVTPLTELLSQRTVQGADDASYLFTGYTGPGGKVPTENQISDSGVYKLFKLYCRAAGGGDDKTPHSARATAITRLLEEGFSHREVREFSRHASVQMVELYDKRRFDVDRSPGKKLRY